MVCPVSWKPFVKPVLGPGRPVGREDAEGAVRGGAVRGGAVRGGAVREGAVREGAVREGAVKEGAVKEGAVKEGAVVSFKPSVFPCGPLIPAPVYVCEGGRGGGGGERRRVKYCVREVLCA